METPSTRVLLIDDDEAVFGIFRELLQVFGGGRYCLDWAGSYDAGLQALLLGEHDVCLLDYMLGSRNGLDLLRAAVAAGCQTPVILASGMGGPDVDRPGMKAGA